MINNDIFVYLLYFVVSTFLLNIINNINGINIPMNKNIFFFISLIASIKLSAAWSAKPIVVNAKGSGNSSKKTNCTWKYIVIINVISIMIALFTLSLNSLDNNVSSTIIGILKIIVYNIPNPKGLFVINSLLINSKYIIKKE
jgi:hypothetical protein